MLAEEERRPGEIGDELNEKEQQRKAAPLGAARVKDHREREAEADIEDRPHGGEDPARRRDRRQVERGEPAIAIAAVRQKPHQAADQNDGRNGDERPRSEEHTSELQSLMRISYAVFCLNNKK